MPEVLVSDVGPIGVKLIVSKTLKMSMRASTNMFFGSGNRFTKLMSILPVASAP